MMTVGSICTIPKQSMFVRQSQIKYVQSTNTCTMRFLALSLIGRISFPPLCTYYTRITGKIYWLFSNYSRCSYNSSKKGCSLCDRTVERDERSLHFFGHIASQELFCFLYPFRWLKRYYRPTRPVETHYYMYKSYPRGLFCNYIIHFRMASVVYIDSDGGDHLCPFHLAEDIFLS